MWEVPENVSVLQRGDETLKPLFAKVGEGVEGKCGGKAKFIVDHEVLHIVEDGHKRLVVPASCRSLVMHLAHTLPWSSHLGRHISYLCVSSRFFWPSMYTDIQNISDHHMSHMSEDMHCPQV